MLLSETYTRLGPLFEIIKYHYICHHLRYFSVKEDVASSSGFYFEKNMHVEMLWWQRQPASIFEEMERFSQVNWHDVGMHAAL